MMSTLKSCVRTLHTACTIAGQHLRKEDGNAIVELALAFSFLLTPLMLATTEIAFMVYDSIEVTNSAHAGAMYGMISSTLAGDATGIQNAALGEAGDVASNMTVTSTTYYACSAAVDGTRYATQAAANTVCPANAGNHYLQFIQVTSTANITPPIRIIGLPSLWALQGKSVMEVQE